MESEESEREHERAIGLPVVRDTGDAWVTQDECASDGSLRASTISPSGVAVRDVLPENLSVQDLAVLLRTTVRAWQELQAYYRCALMEVETKFKVLNEQFSLQYDRNPIETIKTRIKTPESLAEKMQRKGLSFSLDAVEREVYDVAGIRVICSFLDDIYLLADCLTSQDDIRLLQCKDYIANPKPNGYRGLHLIVEVPIFLSNEKRPMKVEVQLRTIAMDFWASLEHKLRYKKKLDVKLAAELEGELTGCADMAAELDGRMQTIRDRIDASRATR